MPSAAPPADASMTRTPRAAWWLGFALASGLALALTWAAYAERLPIVLNRVAYVDKAFHTGLAGLLAFFLDGALGRRDVRVLGRFVLPAAVIGVLLPTGLEETLQRLSAVRESSLWDFAADVVGAGAFTWLSRRMSG